GNGVQTVGRRTAVGSGAAGRVAGNDPSRGDRRAGRVAAGCVVIGVVDGGCAPSPSPGRRTRAGAAVPETGPNTQIGSTNPARANERGDEPFAKGLDSRPHPTTARMARGGVDTA